jgi:hypothetical protein
MDDFPPCLAKTRMRPYVTGRAKDTLPHCPGKEPVYGIAPSLIRLLGEILNIVVPAATGRV